MNWIKYSRPICMGVYSGEGEPKASHSKGPYAYKLDRTRIFYRTCDDDDDDDDDDQSFINKPQLAAIS